MKTSLIIFLSIFTQNLFATTSGTVDDGIKAFKEANFQEAEKLFQEAVEGEPESGILHYNLGTAKFKNGDFEGAIEEFAKSLSDSTLRGKATYNIGNSLLTQGINDTTQSTEALEKSLYYYKKVLKENQENNKARRNLELAQQIIAQRKQQQQDQQQQDQNQEEKPPASDEAKRLKAEIEKLISKRRYLEALDLTQQAVEFDETFMPNFATFTEIVGELAEIFNR
ncbi:MAG: hypothetical protein DWQ06_04975 [Calditrichaeota bacterium]|nr:MAG: hypothetical protein DWQ06_04975 [Calditrichota bacterium]